MTDAPKLPTKDEFALKVLTLADECQGASTRLDYLKLAADVMGFLPRAGVNVAVQTNVVQKVMKVPAYANREEARRGVMEQQAELVRLAEADAVKPGPRSRH